MRLATARSESRLDTRLSYCAAGPWNGKGVIGFHGFTLSGKSLIPILDGELLTRRIILPDLRGHGRTSLGNTSPGTFFDDCAADAFHLCRTEGTDRLTVFGHSMGALAALTFWDKFHTEIKIERIVLECPVLGNPIKTLPESLLGDLIKITSDWIQWAFENIKGAGDALLRLVKSEAGFYAALVGLRMLSNYRPNGEFRKSWEHVLDIDSEAMAVAYRAMVEKGKDVMDILRRVDAPVVIIACRDDPLVSFKTTFEVYDRAIDGRHFSTAHNFVGLSEGGHMPHIENKARFLEVAGSYLYN